MRKSPYSFAMIMQQANLSFSFASFLLDGLLLRLGR